LVFIEEREKRAVSEAEKNPEQRIRRMRRGMNRVNKCSPISD